MFVKVWCLQCESICMLGECLDVCVHAHVPQIPERSLDMNVALVHPHAHATEESGGNRLQVLMLLIRRRIPISIDNLTRCTLAFHLSKI